jgi:AhpD family alkylhydroperoxidase
MTQRLDYPTIAADGMKVLEDLHKCVARSGLRYGILNLVYLRASQINGCAFCIDMHSRDLAKSGVPSEKLALLSVWREVPELFSEQERAALAWCERVTNISQIGVPEDEYEAARLHFSDKELVNLTMAIGLINVYNRLGISFRLTPEGVKSKAASV